MFFLFGIEYLFMKNFETLNCFQAYQEDSYKNKKMLEKAWWRTIFMNFDLYIGIYDSGFMLLVYVA